MRKTLTIVAILLALGLALPALGESKEAPEVPEVTFGAEIPQTEGDQACVRVFCDGEFGGLACGQTTPDIIEGAIELCENV